MPTFRLTVERTMTCEVLVDADNEDEAEVMFFGGGYDLEQGSEVTHKLNVIAICNDDPDFDPETM